MSTRQAQKYYNWTYLGDPSHPAITFRFYYRNRREWRLCYAFRCWIKLLTVSSEPQTSSRAGDTFDVSKNTSLTLYVVADAQLRLPSADLNRPVNAAPVHARQWLRLGGRASLEEHRQPAPPGPSDRACAAPAPPGPAAGRAEVFAGSEEGQALEQEQQLRQHSHPCLSWAGVLVHRHDRVSVPLSSLLIAVSFPSLVSQFRSFRSA